MRWLLRFTSLSAADVHIRVSLHKSDSHMSPVLTIKIKYVISSLKRQWLKKSSADINKLSSRQLTFAHSNTCYNKLYVTGLCENLRELVRLNCAFVFFFKKVNNSDCVGQRAFVFFQSHNLSELIVIGSVLIWILLRLLRICEHVTHCSWQQVHF